MKTNSINNYKLIADKYSIKEQSAIVWWETLSETEKNDYAKNVFGDPEFWEDGELERMDIYQIYKKYAEK